MIMYYRLNSFLLFFFQFHEHILNFPMKTKQQIHIAIPCALAEV